MRKLIFTILLGAMTVIGYSQCTVGDPTVFGDNSWICYGYQTDGAFGGSGSYSGFYTFNALSFDTDPTSIYANSTSWTTSSSPSASSAWSGCGVLTNDNHSYTFKRMGVPSCGSYTIEVMKNNSAQLWINGVLIWEESQTVSDQGEYNFNTWSGYLDENSLIEYRVMAGSGSSRAGLVFNKTSSSGILATYSSANSSTITVDQNELQYSNVFANGFKTSPGAVSMNGSAVWSSSAEAVQLTTGGNQTGTMSFTPATTMNGFVINYDMRIPSVAVANGISFNYGNFNPATGGGEGGFASGLSVCFRTVAIPDAIDVKWNGVVIGSGNSDITGAGYFETTIEVTDAGYVTVKYGPNQTLLIDNLLIPAYASTDKSGWKMAFSGKTAALSINTHGIDDINLYATDQAEYQIDGGAWQSNHIFSNVVDGSHILNVRNAGNPLGCVSSLNMVTPFSISAVNAVLTATDCAVTDYTSVNGGISIISFDPLQVFPYERVIEHNGVIINTTTGTFSSSPIGTASLPEYNCPLGISTVTYTFSSGSPISYTVVVNDGQPATITAPDDITVCDDSTPNLGSAIYNTLGCGGVVTNDAPASFPTGTTTVVWTVTYADGDVATDTQIVTVNASQQYYIDTDGDGYGTTNPPAVPPVYLAGGPAIVDWGSNSATYISQTFTVSTSGLIDLDIAIVLAQCVQQGATGAILDIVTTTSGLPNLGNVIASSEIPSSEIPVFDCDNPISDWYSGFVHFIVSNVNLNSGEQYAFVVRKSNPAAIYLEFLLVGDVYPNAQMQYSWGNYWSAHWANPGADLAFHITQNFPATLNTCNIPSGYSLYSTDCDDSLLLVNPVGVEICGNNIDEDCSGADLVCPPILGCTTADACNYDATANEDDGSCVFSATYYKDTDGDGYGSLTPPFSISPVYLSGGPTINSSQYVQSLGTYVGQSFTISTTGPMYLDIAVALSYCDELGTTGARLEIVNMVNLWPDFNTVLGFAEIPSSELPVSCDPGFIPNTWVHFIVPNINLVSGQLYAFFVRKTNPDAQNIRAGLTGNLYTNGVAMYSTPTSTAGYPYKDLKYNITEYSPQIWTTCHTPSGYSLFSTDCDETSLQINPVGVEICGNNIDEDCSGADLVCPPILGCTTADACNYDATANEDDGSCVLPVTYYLDEDADGWHTAIIQSCSIPGSEYVSTTMGSGDCDDLQSTIYPGASEICGNNIDEDCSNGDETCAIPGCMDVSACNFNPLATVSDNSCVMPTMYYSDMDLDGFGNANDIVFSCFTQINLVSNSVDCDDSNPSANPVAIEICGNSVDEDCSGADLICPSSGGIAGAVAISNNNYYNFGSQSLTTVPLYTGENSIENPGDGLELWYSFTPVSNAVQITLNGDLNIDDDNDLSLFSTPSNTGIALIPLIVENDVLPSNLGLANDGGSEKLIYDQLTIGEIYYVCVRNINNNPGTCSMNIANFRASQNDIMPYTNYTGVYNNTCQNYKARYRLGASGYMVHRFSNLASSVDGSAPDWSFSVPPGTSTTVSSTVCQLGKITPPNLGTSPVVYYIKVDVLYNPKDAWGNIVPVTAIGVVSESLTLNPELPVFVRSTDQCPAYKSTFSSIATNRTVCGIGQYQWQFTQILPSSGVPMQINGSLGGARTMAMSAIPGIGNGQKYDVQIRGKHADNSFTEFSTTSCVRTIGAAGMVVLDDNQESNYGVENHIKVNVFPNPSIDGSASVLIDQEIGLLSLKVMDGQGKLVNQQLWDTEETNMITLNQFASLANGIYHVIIDGEKYHTDIRWSILN